jgi:capsular polysaccharide biosynthesis protein
MELKEYLQIIKRNIATFAAVIIIVVLGSFAFFALKSVTFSTSLALNITRSGAQQTPDYKYDDFYRLQADEKFAETIVQWLQDPRTAANIYAAAGMDVSNFSLRQLAKSIAPKKLSSQFVSVSFSARSVDSAKKISNAIVAAVAKNTGELNKNQNESTWFEVVAQDPVIARDKISPLILFLASLLAGIFLACWVVLIIHYLK